MEKSLRLLGAAGACAALVALAAFTAVRHRAAARAARRPPADRTTVCTLSQLWVFPVKSCCGMSVSSWEVTAQGLKYDREWAVFKCADNNVMTLREFPVMKCIHATVEKDVLTLSFSKTGESFAVPLNIEAGVAEGVLGEMISLSARNIRGLDGAFVRDQGRVASERLTRWIGVPVFLGRMERCVRLPIRSRLDGTLCDGTETVLLHDFASLTMCSEEGLELLRNKTGNTKICCEPMRMNIVVQGSQFPDEDTWATMRIGAVTLRTARCCTRCIGIEIPADALQANEPPDHTGRTPPRALDYLQENRCAALKHRGSRDAAPKPMFGLSLFHQGSGRWSLGDSVTVLTRRESPAWQQPLSSASKQDS